MAKRAVKIVISFVVLFGGLAIVYFNRYSIYDWERLHDYRAPQSIASLADQTSMTSRARNIFYTTYPQINDKTTFNTNCKVTEQTIVLGCYTAGSIFIFDVKNVELHGVQQVTAAHEMLHAVYVRLSPSEKKHVDAMLEDAYKNINDPALIQTIASYRKNEPGQQDNELHSILATEYANIGTNLETYYKQYFNNRAVVVSYSNQYKQVFQDIKNQVAQDDAQLAEQKIRITALEASLSVDFSDLQAQKNKLQGLMKTLPAALYNAEVENYNNQVDQYNAQVAVLQAYIATYNALVVQRNALAVQQQGLANSLNSIAPTATAN
jgi:hypothetical protein